MKYDPKDAVKHLVHDYVYLVAAGTDTQRPHGHPFNHYAERTFLVHCRAMAEFFSGEKEISPVHFTRGPFTPSLPTWKNWKSHVNMHLMHVTRGRITNKILWTGEANGPMLKEFREVWGELLGEMKDDFRPLFEEEIDKYRKGFVGYQL